MLLGSFLTALSDMDVTLPSMDVFNRTVNLMNLPPEFIHTFISSCIAGCQSTEDKFMQMRLVRLVCVVIQALIRNKTLDVNDGVSLAKCS